MAPAWAIAPLEADARGTQGARVPLAAPLGQAQASGSPATPLADLIRKDENFQHRLSEQEPANLS